MIPALDAMAAILPKPAATPALLGDGTFAALLPLEGEAVEEDEPVEPLRGRPLRAARGFPGRGDEGGFAMPAIWQESADR